MMISKATLGDVEEITAIYNQAIKPHIYAAAVLAPVSVESRIAWLQAFADPFGAWVYRDSDGAMLGWCSLNPCPIRPGITTISEISVYVAEGRRTQGIGFTLLAFLIEKARQLHFDALMTITYAKNKPSISVSRQGGFELCGTFDNISFRDHVLQDVVWLQKNLNQADPESLTDPKERIAAFL